MEAELNDKLESSKEHGSEEKVTGDNKEGKNNDDGSLYSDPFQGLSFTVGVAENKNITYRAKMEDVHTYVANFAEKLDWGYFGIFDGHAGKQAARWCGNNLHALLEDEILREEHDNGASYVEQHGSTIPRSQNCNMKLNLNEVFIKADKHISKETPGSSGCTAAVMVLIWEYDDKTDDSNNTEKDTETERNARPVYLNETFDFVPSHNHKRMLYTSNVGDLRIILYRQGKVYRLTYDHKATDPNEIARIKDSGGLVMKNRVNGVLAITRALGDSYMKDLIIGNPFTTSTELTSDDEFVILACDGLWDVVSDADACKFVADIFKTLDDPQYAAKKLCQLAMDNSTTDNVTVMIVKFNRVIFNAKEELK